MITRLEQNPLLDIERSYDLRFDNPVSLWAGGNPRFFEGTAVEDAVAARV